MDTAGVVRPFTRSWPVSRARVDGFVAFAVLAISYAALFRARGWTQFFDESDNYLGGHLIARGAVLYRDYFSHHVPLPYYLAAIPSLLGITDLVGLRVFTSLVILGFWTFIIFRFKSRLPSSVLYLLVLTIAAAMPYFLGFMLLAETIESYCLLILVLYLLTFPELDWSPGDQIVIAGVVFTSVMCSLLSVYPLLLAAAYYGWRLVGQRRGSSFWPTIKAEARFAALVGAPFLLVLVLLATNGVLTTFWQDAFTFNQVYYSKYALASNPVLVLRTIVRSDYWMARDNLNPLAWQNVDGFSLVANVITFGLLARRRGLVTALAFGSIAALSRGRGATFHDQAYYLISIFSAAYAITWAGQAIVNGWRAARSEPRVRLGARTIGAGVGIAGFLLLAVAFYGNVWLAQPRDVATPYTFDYRDVVATLTTPSDPIWIVPLDFYAYLDLDRAPATRYAFYLPWLADSPAINRGILDDLARTRPPVIIYPAHYWLIRSEAGERQVFALDHYGQAMRAQILNDYVPADATNPRLQAVLLRKDLATEQEQRLRSAGILNGTGSAPPTAAGR